MPVFNDKPLVEYYLEGWRYGYLEKIDVKKQKAAIRPIVYSKIDKRPNCVHIPLTDVRDLPTKGKNEDSSHSSTRPRNGVRTSRRKPAVKANKPAKPRRKPARKRRNA